MATRNRWPYNTARWQRLRLMKLAERPLCENCARQYGRVEAAKAVDHRTPIPAGGDNPANRPRLMAAAFPHLDDLASLCVSCHNQKTRAEQTGERHWLLKGCDVFGQPLDRSHSFYKE
jgi:5-methylcytosine-specific restriction enzyme A